MKLPELLDQLDAAGFYRFVDPDRIAAFKKESSASGIIFSRDTGRLFGTSGETIFYGGVKNLLGELSGTLRKLGVNLALNVEYVTVTARHPTTGEAFEFLKRNGDAKDILPAKAGPGAIAVTQNYVEDERYTITLNGATWPIWDASITEDPWNHAANNVLKMLNALLHDAGSDERVYWMTIDDCDVIIILTGQQHTLIQTSALLPITISPEAACMN